MYKIYLFRGDSLDKIKEELENKLRDFNGKIKARYNKVLNISNENFRDFIDGHIGKIHKASKPNREELLAYEEKGGIVGVDASVNRKGGAAPHYIEIYRALAKSTIRTVEPRVITKVYSPILGLEEDLSEEDEASNMRDKTLSRLEVQVAIDAAKNIRPAVIMMDGGFVRYNIDCKELWLDLREICEREKIILIGVIEDIKTSFIGERLKELGYTSLLAYDRELLFGRLDKGEYILVDDRVNSKSDKGELASAFMRSSLSPNIIGIDIIDTQRKYLSQMVSLVYGLTPENSRGVPIWLDIVDKEAKISSRMMEAFLESHLDKDIYERFFVETRSRRS